MQPNIPIPRIPPIQPHEHHVLRPFPRLARPASHAAQHPPPRRHRIDRPPPEGPTRRLDPHPRGGVHLLRLIHQPRRQPRPQRLQRLDDPPQRPPQPLCRRGQPGHGRKQVALQRSPRHARPRLAVARHPSQHLAPQQPQQRLGRVRPIGVQRVRPQQLLHHGVQLRVIVLAQPSPPARRRQRPRGLHQAASSGAPPEPAGRPPDRSSRRRNPRARDRPPSAPSSQRRSSAVSAPDSTAENAPSAASNT